MSGWGLEGALSALRAAQHGLDVTGQNLAGSDVPGYVRRRVDAETVGPAAGVARLWATVRPGAGGGVSTSVNRLADVVLDARSRVENARSAAAQIGAATYAGLEQVFDEPTDTGLSAALDAVWNAFGDVANGASGTVVLGAAATAADRIRHAATALDDATSDARTTLSGVVGEAADLLGRVGELNTAIAAASASGQPVPDLLDQRDRLTDRLATSIGARTTVAVDGSATVTLGDTALVTGSTVAALAVGADATVTVDGAAVALTSGTAAATVAAITTTLPGYRARLDAVANSLRDTVNSVLQAGYTSGGAPGQALFTGTGAGDLDVAITDPADLATAASPGTTDTSVAAGLSQAGLATDGPDARYRDLVGTLGAESARAAGTADTSMASAAAIDAARTSAEGVSVDEELSAMLAYQRSYQAASRVLTTVDDMLDQLINRTGRVGT